jgi:hypothetical protein
MAFAIMNLLRIWCLLAKEKGKEKKAGCLLLNSRMYSVEAN